MVTLAPHSAAHLDLLCLQLPVEATNSVLELPYLHFKMFVVLLNVAGKHASKVSFQSKQEAFCVCAASERLARVLRPLQALQNKELV